MKKTILSLLICLPILLCAQYHKNVILISPSYSGTNGLGGEVQYRYNFTERSQGVVGLGLIGKEYKQVKVGYRYQAPFLSNFTFGFGADLLYGVNNPELDGANRTYEMLGFSPEIELHYFPTKHLDLFIGSSIRIKLLGDEIKDNSGVLKFGVGYRF